MTHSNDPTHAKKMAEPTVRISGIVLTSLMFQHVNKDSDVVSKQPNICHLRVGAARSVQAEIASVFTRLAPCFLSFQLRSKDTKVTCNTPRPSRFIAPLLAMACSNIVTCVKVKSICEHRGELNLVSNLLSRKV